MQTVMNHNFSKIPQISVPRSVFNRSHGYKTTFEAGQLVPILTDEVLPGDTFDLKTTLFARLATPIFPIMDNMYVETFFFFVPNRIIWDNWEKFNGAQDDPGDSIDFLVPQVESGATGFVANSIADYFGIPVGGSTVLGVSAFHFRAYNLIFNDWFRDQNLTDSLQVPKGDGPDAITLYPLQERLKRHDYFTSCLPFPQKGDAVVLPLVNQPVPVVGTGNTLGLYEGTNLTGIFNINGGTGRVVEFDKGSYNVPVGTAVSAPAGIATLKGVGVPTAAQGISGMEVDLSSATAATINQLREAFMIQKVLETDARGGTRYTEMIKAHFGVTNPDFRLQRPEYLGGGSTRVNINPVQQTSQTDPAVSPQGNLAAFGTAADSSHSFNKSFTEHGVIIGLINVRADLTYQQGLPRMWSRLSRFDFYLPSLAHLGEQAVLNKEIFYDNTDSLDDATFGFQERWAEYRYKQSQITALFRSSAAGSLDAWHISQNFSARPLLNDSFLHDETEDILNERVVAVNTEPNYLLDVYFEYKCARPMPVYSVPGLSAHF